MINQNIVGQPAAGGNNALMNGRSGALGDTIVSELHGGLYETNYQGNLFFGGHGSLVALSANTITLTATTTPILGLWNPTSNTKKNAVTMNMVTKAQPKSASSTRSRRTRWCVSVKMSAKSWMSNLLSFLYNAISVANTFVMIAKH